MKNPLLNMKMTEGGSIADHLNEFNTLTSQLISVKMIFEDEVMALLILFSLSERWKKLAMDVINFVPCSGTLELDDVVVLILSQKV